MHTWGDQGGVLYRIRRALPQGRALADHEWTVRHRWMVRLVYVHAVFLFAFGLMRGFGVVHSLSESAVIAAAAVVASTPLLNRHVRAIVAALGLVGASAVFVHMSGGVVEIHFHFFVVIGLLSLYQEWGPFLAAIVFVVLHHGILGAIAPDGVYNHQSAIQHPWRWAAIHGGFVLAASVANLIAWRINEQTGLDLHESQERFRRVFDNAAVGMCMVDTDGFFTAVNATFSAITGYPEDELVGTTPWAITHPDDRARSQELSHDLWTGREQSCELEKRYIRKNGEVVHVYNSLSAIKDVDGRVIYTAGIVQDVSDRRRAEEALAHQAFHDPVTDLPNRNLFLDRLELAVARSERHRSMTAVLFLDVDRFKWVNDSLGHAAGDSLLRTVSERMSAMLRAGDTLARFGGDEFAVLCEEVDDVNQAINVAQRLSSAFAAPFVLDDDRAVTVTASIGIAMATSSGHTPETLLRDADSAMYRAKDKGRDRIEVFDDEMRASAMTRLETEAALRHAIDANELCVHYQPIVDLAGEQVLGVEALVRWQHPERGLVAPLEFIPLAEDTGLIVPIGTFVLTEACRTMAEWNHAHPDRIPLSVSVNLSARQLASPGLPRVVAGVLTSTGLQPEQLCLEITESVLMEDADTSRELLESLKRLGVTIAVDDFGTGYSSLLYLRRFPVDVLKIDRSFVSGLGTASEDSAIVSGVVSLAHALGLHSVAEGVEQPSQAAELGLLGCDRAQGFYWSRPLEPLALAEWLEGKQPSRITLPGTASVGTGPILDRA
jgi:diguanylate cyclase (GGDEF)-like protein/PAS domain S-box-containing protein